MNRDHKNIILLLIFLVVFTAQANAQQNGPLPKDSPVNLFTDRSLYVVGENVCFTAMADQNMTNGDRVLYVEVITPDGTSINGGKYLLENQKSHGSLAIPKEVLSGIYYCRAYTRTMRNYGPFIYAYVPLKIVNPFNEDVLAGNPDDTAWQSRPLDLKGMASTDIVEILAGEKEYQPGENIRIRVRCSSGAPLVSLAVIPEATVQSEYLEPPENPVKSERNDFIPENRGVSLTGRVRDKLSGEDAPLVTVNLSVINDKDFMATLTDSSGRFYFSFPEQTGSGDLFVSPGDLDRFDVLVDNDFCTAPVRLPAPVFTLTGDERKAAYNLTVNSQVAAWFDMADSLEVTDKNDTLFNTPFYGEPTQVLPFDKYIQLPSLEEYFNELPVAVKVRKRQGEKYFKYYDAKGIMAIYDPLVMIDWVAVSDIEAILSAPTQLISRIELVNAPYMKGDMVYGGIVSIISKKGDFAGIDLPRNGIFINYKFYSDTTSCAVTGRTKPGEPDPRNTLLWIPDLVPAARGEREFEFPASYTPGTYEVIVRVLDNRGNVQISREQFEVMPR